MVGKKHKQKANSEDKRKLIIAESLILLVVAVVAALKLSAPKAPELSEPPLKDLAAMHGVALGNSVSFGNLTNKIYTNILTSQYNTFIIDGEGNWAYFDGILRPSPTKFNYTNTDKLVDFAKDHEMPIRFQHLVWGEAHWLPKWLKNGNYSQQQLLSLIHNHISNLVGHYKGQIRTYTVVNEAFTRSQHIDGLQDWWADHIGNTGYIDDSFIWAHQADLKATLLLNDFDNEIENSVSDSEYNYVKTALVRGVPIEGIGMQMHIDAASPPNKEDVIKNIRRFAKLGLPVYITEFDVNFNKVNGSAVFKNQLQAQIAYNMVRACIESKDCLSFGQLHVADYHMRFNSLHPYKPHSYLFTTKYQPKPAFYSFRQAWQQP